LPISFLNPSIFAGVNNMVLRNRKLKQKGELFKNEYLFWTVQEGPISLRGIVVISTPETAV
jgi:hypothetical protein